MEEKPYLSSFCLSNLLYLVFYCLDYLHGKLSKLEKSTYPVYLMLKSFFLASQKYFKGFIWGPQAHFYFSMNLLKKM